MPPPRPRVAPATKATPSVRCIVVSLLLPHHRRAVQSLPTVVPASAGGERAARGLSGAFAAVPAGRRRSSLDSRGAHGGGGPVRAPAGRLPRQQCDRGGAT